MGVGHLAVWREQGESQRWSPAQLGWLSGALVWPGWIIASLLPVCANLRTFRFCMQVTNQWLACLEKAPVSW